MRHLPRLTLLTLTFLTCFQPGRASADIITVTSASDHWFTYEEPAVFKVRAYASQNGIDSMLWLYDSWGNLLAQNDDFFGLDSWLEVQVEAGSYRLRAGVCCGNPDAWYGQSYTLDVNTTPAEPTTTSTTTEPPTTTTSTTSTTTTEPSTTTTSTTSTVPETTTTTEVTTWPPTLPSTTSTSTVPPTSAPSTSTTTLAPPPLTTTTSTPPTVPPTSAPETTIPPTTETPPDTSNLPSDSLPAPDPTEPPSDSLDALTDEITASEATELATNPETLAEATPDQAAEIFDAIVPDDLTKAEAEAIVAAVQNAPTEIRAAFETEINVFDGQFDTYVPLGSTVDVGTRRTVTAGTVTMGVIAITPSRRKQ